MCKEHKYCKDCNAFQPIENFGRVYKGQDTPRQTYCLTHDYQRCKASRNKKKAVLS